MKIKSLIIDAGIMVAGILAILASYHYYQMDGSKMGILFGLIVSFVVGGYFSTKINKRNWETEK
jgi:uncharacterized membrane-anchored protein